MTHVPAILELPEILREMLRADMDMRAVDPPLERRPEAFDPVHCATVGADVFLGIMGDGLMPEATRAEAGIAAKRVRVDRGAGEDVRTNDREEGIAADVRDNARNQLAALSSIPRT